MRVGGKKSSGSRKAIVKKKKRGMKTKQSSAKVSHGMVTRGRTVAGADATASNAQEQSNLSALRGSMDVIERVVEVQRRVYELERVSPRDAAFVRELQRRVHMVPGTVSGGGGGRGCRETGIVYALHDPVGKRVKFGMSSYTTTANRLAALRTGAPEYIEIDHVQCKRFVELERRLMNILGPLRVHATHEIFDVSVRVVKPLFDEIRRFVDGAARVEEGMYDNLTLSRGLMRQLFG